MLTSPVTKIYNVKNESFLLEHHLLVQPAQTRHQHYDASSPAAHALAWSDRV